MLTCPYDTTSNIADVPIDLIQSLAILNDNDSDIEDKLYGLKNIQQVTCHRSISSKGDIAVRSQGIMVRVKLEEHVPDLPTSVSSQSSKDCVQGNSWAVTHLRQCPSGRTISSCASANEIGSHIRDRVRSKNVCCDEIENSAPCRCFGGSSCL